MIRSRLALVVALVVAATTARVAGAPGEIVPFEDLRPGMIGRGYTVFEGTRVVSFDAEILGTLPRHEIDHGLILARLSGEAIDDAGVLAGMSGSPIEIDGRVIGAVAFAWGFAKEAVAGVRPIEAMLGEEGSRNAGSFRPGRWDPDAVARLARPELAHEHLRTMWERRLATTEFPHPLTVRGIAAEGLRPASASEAGVREEEIPEIVPGSAIGIQWVRGDVEIAATGTATWIDGDRLLGLGHKALGLGEVDLPLTSAHVEAIVPSRLQSLRLASTGPAIGAVRRDATVGIEAVLGAEAQMIPVRLRVEGECGAVRDWSFEIADDPLLGPLLLHVVLRSLFLETAERFPSESLRFQSGSVIRLGAGESVALDNVYATSEAVALASAVPAYALYLLMNNPWQSEPIAGINLLAAVDRRSALGRVALLEAAAFESPPGSELELRIALEPFREAPRVYRRRVLLPRELAGERLIVEASGIDARRVSSSRRERGPRSFSGLVRFIEEAPRNDLVSLRLYRADGGAVPDLPPVAESLMGAGGARGQGNGRLVDLFPVPVAVVGSARVEVQVAPW